MDDTLQPYLAAAVTIVVDDTNHPECAENRPFQIYRFEGQEEYTGSNRGRVSKGYIIKKQDNDPRWVKGDRRGLEAWHLGASRDADQGPCGQLPPSARHGSRGARLPLCWHH